MKDSVNTAPPQYLLLMAGTGDQTGAALVERLERGGYTVICADGAGPAVEHLQSGRRFEAVVACTGPGRNDALELLERTAGSHPGPVRVLVAGADETESFAPLLNRGAVERLLLRPCAAEALFGVVDEAVRQRCALMDRADCGRRTVELEQRLLALGADPRESPGLAADTGQYYDALTGLVNRTLLEDRLGHAIEAGKRNDQKVVLFLLGMDHFQEINERFGREVADQVLVDVARRIKGCVRSSDTVGRYGGDVFGLVVVGSRRAEDPGVMAQRVLDAVLSPLVIAGEDVVLTASGGIGLFPDDGRRPLELMANAETAMRRAKLQNGNQFQFHSPEFNRLAGRRLSLEWELRRAIEQHEFTLYYQPRIDTSLNRVVGAEALLRWNHPARGVLAPGEFLPVLEETGLIEPVEQWVLEQAAKTLIEWRRASLPPLMLAVNLSARQFHRHRLPELLAAIADAAGLDLTERALELEVTESLLMHDTESTRRTLQRLHEMGMRIAVDDFGTGYSALSYLIRFSLDYLKIDKSFVDRLGESEDAKAIVEAIISLSYSLRLTVIAEGVETREQLNALQALGCKQFQGYLFARPMPGPDFIEHMSRDAGAALATLAPVDRLLHKPISEARQEKG